LAGLLVVAVLVAVTVLCRTDRAPATDDEVLVLSSEL
jgi:hypothetical protein